jgi:cytoskeleton protein RodZ
MTDFGTRLKQVREQRGISQRQIAAATKISVAALEALERNDFSRLPGGIFSRAFVRAYALEVGLDPEATVQEFLTEYEQNYTAREAAAAPEITADDRAFLDRQQRAARWLRAVSIGLIVVLGALVVAWRVASSRASSPPASTTEPDTRGSRSSGPPPPAVSRSSQPPPGAQPAPGAAATNPAAPPAAPTPVAPDQIALRLQSTGDCWVRVTVDGTVAFEQIMTAGVTRDIRPGRDVYLQVGNAGVVQWSINGQPARELGKLGDATAVRINRATMSRWVNAPAPAPAAPPAAAGPVGQ